MIIHGHISDALQVIKGNLDEGYVDPLAAWLAFRAIASEAEALAKEVQALAVGAGDNYPGKRFMAHGFEFEKREGTTRYTYPAFTPYDAAKGKVKALEEMMKKVAASGMEVVDAETGEVVPAAVKSVSEPTLAVKGLAK